MTGREPVVFVWGHINSNLSLQSIPLRHWNSSGGCGTLREEALTKTFRLVVWVIIKLNVKKVSVGGSG